MKKGYDYYLKITLAVLFPAVLFAFYIFTKMEDREDAHRTLQMAFGLLGAFIIAIFHLFLRLKIDKKGRFNAVINMGITLILVALFIWKRSLILSTPMLIDYQYLLFKYSLAGVYLWIVPLMMLDLSFKRSLSLLLNGITLLGGGYIFSNLLLHQFKISAFGFLITAIFMALFYTVSMKQAN